MPDGYRKVPYLANFHAAYTLSFTIHQFFSNFLPISTLQMFRNEHTTISRLTQSYVLEANFAPQLDRNDQYSIEKYWHKTELLKLVNKIHLFDRD